MTEKEIQLLAGTVNQIRRLSRFSPLPQPPLQGQGYVLFHLGHHNESSTPGKLCKELNMTSPRMASILNSLEKQGYLSRQNREDDQRKISVTLTEKGRETLNQRDKAANEYVRNLTDYLGEEDSKKLLELLQRTCEFMELNMEGDSQEPAS